MSSNRAPLRHAAIGQFASLLDHLASLLPHIAEHEDQHQYHVRLACTNSFTTDLRALYGFMLGPQKSRDVHRCDFLRAWTPSQSRARKRLDKFVGFIDAHRDHFSKRRFAADFHRIEEWVPNEYLQGQRLTARGYAYALSDYLAVLDEFVAQLPPGSDEQRLFCGAAFNARYKVDEFLGLPQPT